MKIIRWILLPFSWLYGLITFFRNKLYDIGALPSFEIPKKSIIVGNLSVGGTGKTPHVDYLIQHFLKSEIKLSILSRGYGRKTKGVIISTPSSSASEIGDEPKQYKDRYGKEINVIVAEKRKEGVLKIQNNFPENQLIILDDAFQHRAVKAGLSILITPFNDLFCHDFMLPTGNLREWKLGKNRADAIIVSKCPKNIPENEQNEVIRQLSFPTSRVFFSSIKYTELIPFSNAESVNFEHALIVTGIGNPTPLIEHWKNKAHIEVMRFPDHHNFTAKDIAEIHEKFDTFASKNKVIITTEKDFMRLQEFDVVFDKKYAWHYQPIAIEIKNQQPFNAFLDEYIR